MSKSNSFLGNHSKGMLRGLGVGLQNGSVYGGISLLMFHIPSLFINLSQVLDLSSNEISGTFFG